MTLASAFRGVSDSLFFSRGEPYLCKSYFFGNRTVLSLLNC